MNTYKKIIIYLIENKVNDAIDIWHIFLKQSPLSIMKQRSELKRVTNPNGSIHKVICIGN